MIRHCVFLNLSEMADPDQLANVMVGLASVADRLSGASGFMHGPNRDYEKKSQDYPYGFTIDFDDDVALQAYANDPEHQAQGAQLVAMCTGGADGIIVFDLDI